ncbi:MAG: hypothetical protein KAQ68_04245 [Clostridiales bacterium]|nr:hypothetical protein [Clostridiales bacterium]
MIKIIIVLMLVCTLCVSCMKPPVKPELIPITEESNEMQSPIAEITMLLKTDDFVMENWTVLDTLFKKSGISAAIKTIRPARYIETLNLNLSSGIVYDIMELPPAYAQAADEYIIDAAPLINQYAPNYIHWLNGFSSRMITALSSSAGEIKLFPIRQDVGVVSAIPFIKKEVEGRQFDAVSFYNAITASGGKFAVPGSTMTLCELTAPMFATSTGVIKKSNNNVYGPTTTEFKAMLLYLNSLYSKKLLSETFFVYTPTNLLYDIESGVVTAGIFTQSYYEDAYESGMEPFMFSPVEDAALPGYYNQPTSYAALTDVSGNQEYAIQFINYCFSDEGRRLLNNGVNALHVTDQPNGMLKPLAPFTHVNAYQWKQQGITPDGLPGIYYNYWTQFEPSLYELLIPMRVFGASEDLMVASLPATGNNALASQVVNGALDPVLHEWWTEFIVGSKSLSSDWNEYVRKVNAAGLNVLLDLHYN